MYERKLRKIILLWQKIRALEFVDVLKFLLILDLSFVLFVAYFAWYFKQEFNIGVALQVYGIVASSLAAFVSMLAYKQNSLRPKLRLRVKQYLRSENQVTLRVDQNGNTGVCRPLNEWFITLCNYGAVSGKYPMVKMRFRNVFFRKDAFSGWKAVEHSHGNGYFGFQWAPSSSEIIYPGFSIDLPTLYFQKHTFRSDFSVEFVFVADAAKTNSIVIPIKVIKKDS